MTETRAAATEPNRTENARPLPPSRVSVSLPPGVATLLGHRSGERAGGLVWAGRFPHESAAVVSLLRRALALDEGPAA